MTLFLFYFILNRKFPPSNVPLSNVSPLDVISKYTCKIDSEQIQVRLFAVKGVSQKQIQIRKR